MNSEYVPSDNTILTCDDRKIAVGSSGRAWDEVNHKLVVVELEPWSFVYGEWNPRYRTNGDDSTPRSWASVIATAFWPDRPSRLIVWSSRRRNAAFSTA